MKLPNWIKNFGSVEPDPTVTEESFLRNWRTWAFRTLALLIVVMTVVSLAESFHGLYEWFVSHGVGGDWGYIAPIAIDFMMVIGELAIFTALTGRWELRKRLAPWGVVLLGFGASVAGNVGHVYAQHPLPWDLTALVFPVSAALGILIGFSVLKSLAREKSDRARQARYELSAEVLVNKPDKAALHPDMVNKGIDALIPPVAAIPAASAVQPAPASMQTQWTELDPKDARLRGADLNVKVRNTGQQPILVD
jgi:hypothetical protein